LCCDLDFKDKEKTISRNIFKNIFYFIFLFRFSLYLHQIKKQTHGKNETRSKKDSRIGSREIGIGVP